MYWQPVYHELVGTIAVLVGHAQAMQPRPGHKTDKADARWMAELLAHGLIQSRCVPPPALRALHDLTPTRVARIHTRSQVKNRVYKILEDTTMKLASVVGDLFRVSGRQMLAALMAGERHPQARAALARGRLRQKLPALELALMGQFMAHHAQLIALGLELIDVLTRQIALRDQQSGTLVAPLMPKVEQLGSIPGVAATAARQLLAEIGTDMGIRSVCRH